MNELVITPRHELRAIIAEEVQKLKGGEPTSNPTPEKEVYSNRDAMDFLGVSRSTLQRWREDGILPFRKVNGTILYTKNDLLQMLEDHRG